MHSSDRAESPRTHSRLPQLFQLGAATLTLLWLASCGPIAQSIPKNFIGIGGAKKPSTNPDDSPSALGPSDEGTGEPHSTLSAEYPLQAPENEEDEQTNQPAEPLAGHHSVTPVPSPSPSMSRSQGGSLAGSLGANQGLSTGPTSSPSPGISPIASPNPSPSVEASPRSAAVNHPSSTLRSSRSANLISSLQAEESLCAR
jgi:hypothetical protein